MKIGLFMAFAGRNCGGPEVLEKELTHAMTAVAPENEYHLFCLDRRAPAVIGQRDNIVYHLLQPQFRPISMLASLPRVLSRVRPDVFHAPIIPPLICPMNFIMTMPCSTTIVHPEFYPLLIRLRLKLLLHRGIRKASRVICVSEHVRDITMKTFGVPVDRLPVIYPGTNRLFRLIDEDEKRAFLRERHGIRFPYFLFSGRWEPRKNVARTLEAFALFKRESKAEHKLVFTGSRTWAAREADAVIERFHLAHDVVDLGKTPLDELPYLYGGAEGILFASLWEGFGMPIIEGMACGTPVITSNLAAMPEIAAGAALLVDPYSVRELAAAIRRVAEDAELRASLRALGLKRAPAFTWEKAARDTLDLYYQVAVDAASLSDGMQVLWE